MEKNGKGNHDQEQEKLEQARAEIGVALAKTMDLYGVPPSMGRLYSILYFNDEPLTLDSLGEKMGMSKTSMSTGVRRLEENKMVKKVWQKGIRKHMYKGDTDFFNHFIGFFVPMWKREIEVNMRAIRESEPKLKDLSQSENPDIKNKALKDLDKLEDAKKYYSWLKKLADSIESGEVFEFIPKD